MSGWTSPDQIVADSARPIQELFQQMANEMARYRQIMSQQKQTIDQLTLENQQLRLQEVKVPRTTQELVEPIMTRLSELERAPKVLEPQVTELRQLVGQLVRKTTDNEYRLKDMLGQLSDQSKLMTALLNRTDTAGFGSRLVELRTLTGLIDDHVKDIRKILQSSSSSSAPVCQIDAKALSAELLSQLRPEFRTVQNKIVSAESVVNELYDRELKSDKPLFRNIASDTKRQLDIATGRLSTKIDDAIRAITVMDEKLSVIQSDMKSGASFTSINSKLTQIERSLGTFTTSLQVLQSELSEPSVEHKELKTTQPSNQIDQKWVYPLIQSITGDTGSWTWHETMLSLYRKILDAHYYKLQSLEDGGKETVDLYNESLDDFNKGFDQGPVKFLQINPQTGVEIPVDPNITTIKQWITVKEELYPSDQKTTQLARDMAFHTGRAHQIIEHLFQMIRGEAIRRSIVLRDILAGNQKDGKVNWALLKQVVSRYPPTIAFSFTSLLPTHVMSMLEKKGGSAKHIRVSRPSLRLLLF
jgi:hypothetical protein